MSTSAWFLIAIGVMLAVSFTSRERGVQAVGGLLFLSWVACNLVSEASRHFDIFQPPLKMAIYAGIDVIWLGLILWTCNKSPRARIMRYPLALFYIIGLVLHVVSLVSGVHSLHNYYVGLNVTLACEILTVTITGGAICVVDWLNHGRLVGSDHWHGTRDKAHKR